MYTVIILNKLSSELLKEHRFLFKPFVDEGVIQFCDWQENGTDIKTSVPDLYKCIKGRKEWRAVVVNTDAFAEYRDLPRPSDDNPFDYSLWDSQENNPHESEVPLVRLSHILGGYNVTPTKQFERGYEFFDEDLGEVRRVREADLTDDEIYELSSKYADDFKHVYISKLENQEVLDRQKVLSEKYAFDDTRANEIDFITAKPYKETDEHVQISNSWKSHFETESSKFSERNMYPSNSRFMYFMIHKKDHSLYYRRLTEFWLSVLTVAINEISASFLQAYRVYRLDVDVDRIKLQDEIDENVCRLESIKNFLQKQALRSPDYTIAAEDEIVDDQVIPVEIESGDSAGLYVSTKKIGLSRNCPTDERDFWRSEYDSKMENLWKFLKSPRRAVDRSATQLKDKTDSFYGDTYELDKFQIEDLDEKMNDLKKGIIEFRPQNVLGKKKILEESKELSDKVNEQIATRMTRKKTIIVCLVGIAIYFLGNVPYLVNAYKNSFSMFLSALLVTAGMLAGFSVGGFVVLFILRHKLVSKIKGFNAMMRRLVGEVNGLKDKFEKYFSDICTYMKASSVKEGVKIRNKDNISSKYNFRRHINAARACIERDSEWAAAYNVDMVIKSEEQVSSFFDAAVPPSENSVYYFPTGGALNDIPLNNSGEKVIGPYVFISKLVLEKENIFDEKGDGNAHAY